MPEPPRGTPAGQHRKQQRGRHRPATDVRPKGTQAALSTLAVAKREHGGANIAPTRLSVSIGDANNPDQPKRSSPFFKWLRRIAGALFVIAYIVLGVFAYLQLRKEMALEAPREDADRSPYCRNVRCNDHAGCFFDQALNGTSCLMIDNPNVMTLRVVVGVMGGLFAIVGTPWLLWCLCRTGCLGICASYEERQRLRRLRQALQQKEAVKIRYPSEEDVVQLEAGQLPASSSHRVVGEGRAISPRKSRNSASATRFTKIVAAGTDAIGSFWATLTDAKDAITNAPDAFLDWTSDAARGIRGRGALTRGLSANDVAHSSRSGTMELGVPSERWGAEDTNQEMVKAADIVAEKKLAPNRNKHEKFTTTAKTVGHSQLPELANDPDIDDLFAPVKKARLPSNLGDSQDAVDDLFAKSKRGKQAKGQLSARGSDELDEIFHRPSMRARLAKPECSPREPTTTTGASRGRSGKDGRSNVSAGLSQLFGAVASGRKSAASESFLRNRSAATSKSRASGSASGFDAESLEDTGLPTFDFFGFALRVVRRGAAAIDLDDIVDSASSRISDHDDADSVSADLTPNPLIELFHAPL